MPVATTVTHRSGIARMPNRQDPAQEIIVVHSPWSQASMTNLTSFLKAVRNPFRPAAAGGPAHLSGLEIHAAHTCNLRCESCSHFSNHALDGIVPLRAAEAWMQAWGARLRPGTVGILGGEPTLNPELGGFVQAARRTWPEAEILVTTNGFFLHRHPGLPRILAAAMPATLRLSLHHHGSGYMTRYLAIEALVRGWERDFGIRVQRLPATEQWTRRYHGHGEALRPYAECDAGASFANCSIKNGCHQLLDFRLYKCAPLAYLPLVAKRYALDPAWAPYLAYEPLAPGCSEAELRRWLACGAIPQCAMCPTRYEVIPPSAQPCPLPAGLDEPFGKRQGEFDLK